MVLNEAEDDATVTNKQTESLDRPRPYLPSTAVQGYRRGFLEGAPGIWPWAPPYPSARFDRAGSGWEVVLGCCLPCAFPAKGNSFSNPESWERPAGSQGGREVLQLVGRLQLRSTEAARVWWPHPSHPTVGRGAPGRGRQAQPCNLLSPMTAA